MTLSDSQKLEYSAAFAALLLYGAEQEVSKDNILSVTKAAGVSLPAAYAEVFGKLNKTFLEKMITNMSKVGAAPAAGAPSSAPSKTEEKKKEEPEEEEEEEDGDLMGGLF